MSMNITFPDGTVKQFSEYSTGKDIAMSISEGLARNALGIFVNDIPYDLSRPISQDATIRIVTWNDDEGKQIFWHCLMH